MRRLVLELTEAEINWLFACVQEQTSGAMTEPVIMDLLGKLQVANLKAEVVE